MASVTGDDRVFLDTTVLVAGLIDIGVASEAASSILDSVAAGRLQKPLTAWHCCLAFYSVATRMPPEFRLLPSEARQLLDAEILARFEICSLPVRRQAALFAAAVDERLAGGRIYDLHIGEVARAAGARVLVTDNGRHFSPFEKLGLRVLSSKEFALSRQFVSG